MISPRLQFPLLAALAFSTSALAETPAIKSALQPFVDSHSIAGVVTLVAAKDKVLSVDTAGFSDVAAKTPIREDALFWIASMTKPVTSTAFMILVDEGKVNLDDPVEKYLPEFKDIWVTAEENKDRRVLSRPSHPIKVREVLSHTSGLQFKSGIEQPALDQVPLRVAVLSHTLMPLLFQPSTGYRYSNAGINTAGRIIEVVSGMSYEDFLQKRLFDPLGMKDTTFWPNEAQVKRLAKGYKPNAAKNDLEETTISQLTYPLIERSRQPMPGGGLFSTASDMAKFCQMVLNGGTANGKRLLSEAAIKEMSRRQTPESVKENYGLGWAINADTFYHSGAMATNMTIDPKLGLITIFMVQHAGFPGKGGNCQGAFRKAAIETFGKK